MSKGSTNSKNNIANRGEQPVARYHAGKEAIPTMIVDRKTGKKIRGAQYKDTGALISGPHGFIPYDQLPTAEV